MTTAEDVIQAILTAVVHKGTPAIEDRAASALRAYVREQIEEIKKATG